MNLIDNRTKVTIVTGATGGLGRAFCNELISKNENLLICGTKKEALDALKDELLAKNKDAKVFTFAFNFLEKDKIDELIEFIDNNNLYVSRLINNAGYIVEGSIKNSSKETLMNAIRINCEGTIYLTKSILDKKLKQDSLDIITISSLASLYPMPYMAIYASTKSLIKSFMLALRHEYKTENVKVLVVEPGAIRTSEEMKEAIKAQGFKGSLSCVAPEVIARKSIKKSQKGKADYIPGFFNKMTKFFSHFCPLSLQIKIAGNLWKKSQAKRNIK